MQETISSLEEDETYDELATALSMRKEVLEQKVAENKCDELSAMFNMILDRKRQQQGLFDVDHTIKSSEKKETKGKRSKSAHVKNEKITEKKNVHKGPPALILPTDDNTAESAPHSGNEADHETKFSSFDFLALCSTPTWLGPERRKSRRRSRSPMPPAHVLQHGSQGLSVRSQMKRDYLERQALEMEREMMREERAAAAGLLSPTQDSRQHNSYNDHHIPVSTSLSVPDEESVSSSHHAFRRSSSFKLSRRRARSCGPSQRRKGSFQRSGSVDHHSSDKDGNGHFSAMLNSIRDGRSAPSIAGDAAIHRGGTKTASLKLRRNSTAGSHHVVSSRKQSVDFVDTVRKSFLGVPNYDMHKNNLLTVPLQGSNNSLVKNVDTGIDSKNLLQVPNLEMGSNPLICVPNHDLVNHSAHDTQLSPTGQRGQSATRPGKLTLKECYPPPVDSSKVSSHVLPLLKPLISGPNGPLTSVEVHYADGSNPSSSADLLQTSTVIKKETLEEPHNDKYNIAHVYKQDSLFLDVANKLVDTNLFEVRGDKKCPKHLRLEPTAGPPAPPYPRPLPQPLKPTHFSTNSHFVEVAQAMQFKEKSNVLASASENNVLVGAEGPVIRKDSITDLERHFDGLLLSSDCIEENEDHVDSMTELISDTFREDILAKAKPNMTSPVVLTDSHKMNRPTSVATPNDDMPLKSSDSVGSFSKGSRSGRKSGAGKAKSPTTPTWLNLRTPLARIESFHSDDFECFADSDNDERDSNSSMSATTPTVPCFAYKLHVMKKKQTKLKSSGNGKQSGCGCGTVQNSDYLPSKLNRNSVDKKHASTASGHARLDAAVTDPLLSSGSETEQHDEGQERLRAPGQSKIHPMGTDDRDPEMLNKSDAKCFSYHNAITKQPNQIKNAINRLPRIIPEVEQGAKRRAFVKHLAWRKSFAQFLKRKRYHSPLVTPPQKQQNQLIHRHHQQNQQLHQHHHNQQPSPGNNNNNDLALSDTIPEPRNGISALTQLQTKTLDISTGLEDITVVNSQEGDNFKVAASTLSMVPMENIVTGWGTCRECASEDVSSEEENEYIATVDPTTVMFNLKPIGDNNVHESMNCSQIYQLSST